MFRYYLSAIGILTVLFMLLNVFGFAGRYGFSPIYGGGMVLLSVMIVFLIDAAVAEVVRLLPKKLYSPFRKRYHVFRFEKKLYQRLGIRVWKDKIPETGGLLVKFPKSRVESLRDNGYLFKFMEETCYAEVMHLWSIPFGFLVIFLCPLIYAPVIGIPVAVVNAVLQLLPILVQRYVRPQLMRVYRGNEKREAREAERGEKKAEEI